MQNDLLNHGQPSSESEKLNISGYFSDSTIHLSPYKGLDFSKLAFIFSGQGQMAEGLMKAEVTQHPVFRGRMKELDKIAAEKGLGQPSDFLLKEGSYDKKFANHYSVLTLFSLQIAMFETLLLNKYIPRVFTAHSFGEFAQLTASGVVSFPQMVEFLIERENALAETVTEDYTMFAVSSLKALDISQFPGECYLANRNTSSQSAFVCEAKNFKEIRKYLKDLKIACVKLNVPYPFHTPWLQEAKERLKEETGRLDLEIGAPQIPIVSSIQQKLINKENYSPELIREMMCDQLTTPVEFPKQLEKIHSSNIGHFLEIGPIDVLTPFVEQTFDEQEKLFKATSFKKKVRSAEKSKKSFSQVKDSKVLNIFNKALVSLTGYSVDEIQFEDRIREDLGIDSIKKAEIVFEISDSISLLDSANSAPLNLAELTTFGDILSYFDRNLKAQESSSLPAKEKSIEFSLVKKGFQKKALGDFSSYDQQKNLVRVDLEKVRKDNALTGVEADTSCVVFDCFFDVESQNLAQECSWWARFFRDNKVECKRWILCHGGSAFSRMMAAFLTALAQERESSFKSVSVPSRDLLQGQAFYLESLDFFHNEVKYDEKGERFVKFYETVQAEADAGEEPSVKIPENSKVLFFGGLGGIGKSMLKSLQKISPELVVVFGRRPVQVVAEELSRLELPFALEYRSVDATNYDAANAAVKAVEKEFSQFDVAIHCIGQEFSKFLTETTDSEIEDVIGAKIPLTRVLIDWSEQKSGRLVVLNSSVIAEFGNVGQAPYAMSNRFLDCMSEAKDNVISLLWPAWSGTGMASDTFIERSLKLQGLPSIKPENATQLFLESLGRPAGQSLILSSAFMPDYFSVNQSRFEINGFFQTASKNRQMYVLSGLTQEKMPYLKDHLVKKVCLFPASGSIALMVFRAYQECGEIRSLKNFSAHNFLIVGQSSSNYFLEASVKSDEEIFMQVKSSQLISEGCASPSPVNTVSFSQLDCDFELESEYDQNIAVYIGPSFRLDQGVYYSTQADKLIIDVDLSQSPHYSGVQIFDKIHKLVEASFHSACLRALMDYSVSIVPKTAAEINIYSENLTGHQFYPVSGKVELLENGCVCDLVTLNHEGKVAIEIKNLHLILVEKYDRSAKTLKRNPANRSFFNEV